MGDGWEFKVAGIRVIGGFRGGTKQENGVEGKAAKDRVQSTSINTTGRKRAKIRIALSARHE